MKNTEKMQVLQSWLDSASDWSEIACGVPARQRVGVPFMRGCKKSVAREQAYWALAKACALVEQQ